MTSVTYSAKAETLRTMALVSGTPAGTMFLQLAMFGAKSQLYLYIELVVMAISAWGFTHFMTLAYNRLGLLSKGVR